MGARDMSRDSPRYQENTPGWQGNSAGYHGNSNTTASYHDNFTYYLDYHDEYFSAFIFSEAEETTDESAYGDSLYIPEPTSQVCQDIPLWQLFPIGGIAGIVSRTCTAPFDRAKVLLQVQGSRPVLGSAENLTLLQVMKTMRKEGVRSFWKGNGTNCVKIFPETCARYILFEILCQTRYTDSLFIDRIISGGLTGIIVQTFVYPIELAKTRVMVEDIKVKPLKLLWDGFRDLEKLPGLYRGLIPATLGVVPFAAMELGLSKWLTDRYYHKHQEVPSWWRCTLYGGFSCTAAITCTYPFRLVTCQMQANSGSPSAQLGTMAVVKSILRKDGAKGFYRGYFANALKAVPASAIAWAVLNKGKELVSTFNRSGTVYHKQ